MKQKHLRHALEQLADEGVTRVFKPADGGDWIIGVVGALQLDVLTARLDAEYGLAHPARRRRPYEAARWLEAPDPQGRAELERFRLKNGSALPKTMTACRFSGPQRLGPPHDGRGVAGAALHRDPRAGLRAKSSVRSARPRSRQPPPRYTNLPAPPGGRTRQRHAPHRAGRRRWRSTAARGRWARHRGSGAGRGLTCSGRKPRPRMRAGGSGADRASG